MTAPITTISSRTFTLSQRLLLAGDDSSFTVAKSSSDVFTVTSGVLRIGTGLTAEHASFTGATVTSTQITFTGVKRGLKPNATSITDNSTSYQYDHSVGEQVTYVLHSSEINDYPQLSRDNTFTGTNTMSSTTVASFIFQNVTTAQRLALTGLANGVIVYDTTIGDYYSYNGGSWYALAAGSTQPNMSLTVAGKGEEATAVEIVAGTQAGGTGAELVVNPKYLYDATVSTSAGAGDAGKHVRLNASGQLDISLLSYTQTTQKSYIAGETITAGNTVYKSYSDIRVDDQTESAEQQFQGNGAGGQERIACAFTVADSAEVITSLTLRLKKVGTPADNMTLRIETNSSNLPSGSLAHANATASLAGGSITTSMATYTLSFAGTFSLTAGTKYWLVYSRSGAGDGSNYYKSALGATGTFTYGYTAYSSGNWAAEDTSNEFSCIIFNLTGTNNIKKAKGASYSNDPKKFIGFAAETKTSGQSILVDIGGIATAVSGLTDGTLYKLGSTAGSVTAATTAPYTGEILVGVAQGTTSLLIKNLDWTRTV